MSRVRKVKHSDPRRWMLDPNGKGAVYARAPKNRLAATTKTRRALDALDVADYWEPKPLAVAHYFAYGSNLHVAQMQRRCPDATVVGAAKLPGHRLVFRGVADVEPYASRSVPGGLWRISAADLVALDAYEGWPSLYRRFVLDVELADGTTVPAWTYVMVDRDEQMLPGRYYLDVIVDGYRDFGLGRADLASLTGAVDRAGRWLKSVGVTRLVDDGGKRCREPRAEQLELPLPRLRRSGMSPATLREMAS